MEFDAPLFPITLIDSEAASKFMFFDKAYDAANALLLEQLCRSRALSEREQKLTHHIQLRLERQRAQ